MGKRAAIAWRAYRPHGGASWRRRERGERSTFGIRQARQRRAVGACDRLNLATPDRRPRGRKSMSRRSGQSGYIDRKGNAYYVRFWVDVPGQEKRAHKSVRICPISGPGKLSKPEREREAREIIRKSGADTGELFNEVLGVNLGIRFRQQAE